MVGAMNVALERAGRMLPWLAGVVMSLGLVITARQTTPLALVALPAAVTFALAVLRWPWIAYAALIASVPVQQLGAAGAGGAALTATRACFVIALGAYLVALTVQRRPVVLTPLLVPFTMLVVWMLATTLVATNHGAALAEASRWCIALVAFVIGLQFLAGAPDRRLIGVVCVMAAAGALEAAIGSIRGLLALGPESFAVGTAFARAYGTFGRPNTFAGYLEMTVFPAFWLGVAALPLIRRQYRVYLGARNAGFAASVAERRALVWSVAMAAFLLGCSAAMLGGIALSYSRGAWLGAAAGIGLTVSVRLWRYWPVALAAAPLIALVIVAGGARVAPQALTERITSIADEARPFDAAAVPITDENFAVAERMAHWQAGWHMFEDHPVAGVGTGNFNARYPDYFVRAEFRFSQGHAHNYYIHALAETGIIGLALYLTLILSFFIVALRVAAGGDDALASALALGALGTMTAMYVHNFFENLHVLNLSVQLGATWALLLAARERGRRSRAT
jgi:O-antigen ligase